MSENSYEIANAGRPGIAWNHKKALRKSVLEFGFPM